MALDRQRHRSRRFADGKHERAAVRRLGQVGRDDFERIGRGYRGAKAGFEEFPRRQPKRSVAAASPMP